MSLPNSRKRRLLFLFLAVACAFTASFFFLRFEGGRSKAYLKTLEDAATARELDARAELSRRLAAANGFDSAKGVSVELAAAVFQSVAEHFEGLTMDFDAPQIGAVAVRLDKVKVEFRDGFPRLRGDVAVTAQGRTINAQTLAAIEPKLLPGSVELNVQCLGIAPIGPALPNWAATIANANATAAANRELEKHPITLPLRDTVDIAFSPPKPIEAEIKTPNGKVFVAITLPTVKPVRRWIQPQEAFFMSDGLHLLASISETAPGKLAPASASIAPSNAPGGDPMAKWRLQAGESFRGRLGREPILSLLREVNSWPDANRSVQFKGSRTEGHIIDRTGGAPFGNGFGAWLESPENLNGTVTLKRFTPVWDAEKQRMKIGVAVSEEGTVKVHVHGNPPHIDPPKIFGLKIGGGVTVGGGAGATIQASVPHQDAEVTAAMELDSAAQALEVKLLEPGGIPVKIDIGGVPDELAKLFKLGFTVPLPLDRALYRFNVPTVIADTVVIPLPKQIGGGKKSIPLKTSFNSKLEEEGLQISGSIEVAPPGH